MPGPWPRCDRTRISTPFSTPSRRSPVRPGPSSSARSGKPRKSGSRRIATPRRPTRPGPRTCNPRRTSSTGGDDDHAAPGRGPYVLDVPAERPVLYRQPAVDRPDRPGRRTATRWRAASGAAGRVPRQDEDGPEPRRSAVSHVSVPALRWSCPAPIHSSRARAVLDDEPTAETSDARSPVRRLLRPVTRSCHGGGPRRPFAGILSKVDGPATHPIGKQRSRSPAGCADGRIQGGRPIPGSPPPAWGSCRRWASATWSASVSEAASGTAWVSGSRPSASVPGSRSASPSPSGSPSVSGRTP